MTDSPAARLKHQIDEARALCRGPLDIPEFERSNPDVFREMEETQGIPRVTFWTRVMRGHDVETGQPKEEHA